MMNAVARARTALTTAELIVAVVRLLRLAGTPHDQRILSPAVKREIHWRLLTGPQGGLVRQVGVAGSRIALVGRAIAWIRRTTTSRSASMTWPPRWA